MKKQDQKNITNENKDKSSESAISLFYYYVKNFMRPSPKHPLAFQVLIFILKLPALILFLLLSPVIIVILFITFIVGF
jgi:hypothetical protein